MIVNIQVDLDYDVQGPQTMLLQIEAASTPDQRIIDGKTTIQNPQFFSRVPADEFLGERSWVQVENKLLCNYTAQVELTRPQVDFNTLEQTPIHNLPGDVIKFLMPSRYCHSENFGAFVKNEFAEGGAGSRIAAMRDWIENHFDYVPGSSDENTTAGDTFIQRQGICRDYAHVMVAFARAALIPARVASVYAPDVDPPDFHAVAEVYLSGAWHLIDPTGMAPPETMTRIGVGRDAADISFLVVYGEFQLRKQVVSVTRA